MKMSKSEFKTLMKECLAELINEGAFDKKLEQIAESKNANVQPSYNRYVPQPFVGNSVPQPQNTGLTEQMKKVINYAVGGTGAKNSIMEEILADTAMTTLQTRMMNEVQGNFDSSLVSPGFSKSQNDAELEQLNQLSNGNMSNWKNVIFGK